MIGSDKAKNYIETRDNSDSDNWIWCTYVDTPKGAQRLVAKWNREAGWAKYRVGATQ